MTPSGLFRGGMRMHWKLSRAVLALAVAVVAVGAVPAQAGIARGSFHQTNLVSNIPGMAAITDSDLVNPWGLSSSATSPIWVADNGASVSTLYNGAGQKIGLTVAIPAPSDPPGGPYTGTPTGTVFNGTTDFQVSSGTTSAPSRFLFATEDGTILGWNPAVKPTTAVIAVDRSTATDGAGTVGAVYKGLTNGSFGGANYLYASNFRFGTVEVFDGQFHQQTWAGAFTDSSLPSGFAQAPATFGNFHNAILVGNFGDGRINGFTTAGAFRGQLKSETSKPIQIDGLWGLRFGNGGNGGDPSTLFFAAGINDEADGLYGSIRNVEG